MPADESPPNPATDAQTSATPSPVPPAEGACVCSARRRILLTLAVGLAAALGAVWLQKALWPKTAHLPPPPRQATDPRAETFNWDAPPLPPQTSVDIPLRRGTAAERNLRLQLLCTSALAVKDVLAFYDAELAKGGWIKYNGPDTAGTGLAGSLYSLGNLSLAVHVFEEGGRGCAFRLSVLMRPPASPSAGAATATPAGR